MALRLNLAALTGEELQVLLGEHGTQQRLPEISRARLESRPYPFAGPPVEGSLVFEPLAERTWGATPDMSRQIAQLSTQLHSAGATELGTFYVPLLSEVRHQKAYVAAPDLAIALRWSETPENLRQQQPFLQVLSWLKDHSSGIASVVSTTSPLTSAPTFSAEVDVRALSGTDVPELFAAHRQVVARYGKARKIDSLEAWTKAWQELRRLNITAWQKRGILVEEVDEVKPTTVF